jgi:hypothetical protein
LKKKNSSRRNIRIVLTVFLYSVGYNALGERLQYVTEETEGQRGAEEGSEEERQ